MAAEDLVETLLQDGHLKGSPQPQGQRQVVQGTLRFPLLQEPEPLLGKGERQIQRTHHRLKGGNLPAWGSLGERLEALGYLGHRRHLKEAAQRQLHLQGLAHAPHNLHGQQGVSAKLEEVVVEADLLHPQYLRPDAQQHLLQRSARGQRGAGRLGALRSR